MESLCIYESVFFDARVIYNKMYQQTFVLLVSSCTLHFHFFATNITLWSPVGPSVKYKTEEILQFL